MTFEKAIAILEKYCNDLDSWSQDSNCSTFDSDVALTKEMLESLIYYLEVGDWSSASTYIPFLEELQEDLSADDICEAIDVITSTMKACI